ncbi:MAG TPA: TRAP transporter small permease [Beijerinckiaceae bacterium]|nr:TRAP transporter small permease [Beijerinckiaceae bacterium]
MKAAYARAMEALYLACVMIAGVSLTVMTLVIPWGVYTRYVLNRGSAWPEPMAVLLMIVFTFLGAAACYRAGAHIAVTMVVERVPPVLQRVCAGLVHLLMGLLAAFMVYWGILLVQTTWHQVIAEFPFLSAGISYMPIPIGGAITLLFLVELVWIGPPPPSSFVHREPVSTN